MPILTPADQPTYYPSVTQSGAALSGLLAAAQALCESSWGANRPLDLQSLTEIITIHPQFRTGALSCVPISSTPTPLVSVRRHQDSWGRITVTDWFTLDSSSFSIDYEIGQLNLLVVATEAKVTYSAGFDFTQATQEIANIKALAGMVVDYLARRHLGQLTSYLNNPPGEAVESFNVIRPDTYLETILRPLRKVRPSTKLWLNANASLPR